MHTFAAAAAFAIAASVADSNASVFDIVAAAAESERNDAEVFVENSGRGFAKIVQPLTAESSSRKFTVSDEQSAQAAAEDESPTPVPITAVAALLASALAGLAFAGLGDRRAG